MTPEPLAIGQTRDIPFRLSTQVINVTCVVLDQRTNFGRSEWQIAPVAGDGTAWIREDKLAEGLGPTVRTPSG